jgi:uncharacterized protein YcbX
VAWEDIRVREVGRVTGIGRYPVKSMQGEQIDRAEVGPAGIDGDRKWAVRDRRTGEVLSAKREPRLLMAAARIADGDVQVDLPGQGTWRGQDPRLSGLLSDWLGRDVALERAGPATEGMYKFQLDGDEAAEVLDLPVMDGTFFDLAAVHLLTTASLRAAAKLDPAVQWDVRRFRPTFLLDVDGEGFVEDSWTERVVVGGVTCAVIKPTMRCAMPMREQPGLVAAPDLMPALKGGHNSLLGLYLEVTQSGQVALGDTVQVET